MNIVDYIPVGSKNAISRQNLCTITGMSDRVVREAISQARRTTCICNAQDGKGYYIPDSMKDAKRFLDQESARARSIFWSLKGARDFIKEMEKAGHE